MGCPTFVTLLTVVVLVGAVWSALADDAAIPRPSTPCPPVQKLQALPGFGWDNLQNKEMRPVIVQTFDQCRQTLDGRYSLPDGAFDQPVRSSNVEIVSELIEHWSNYTDVTARSMRVSASLYIDTVMYGEGGIGGSFTDDYRSTKRQQYDDEAMTTRTVARYVQYAIGTDSNYRLHPEFESRLRAIADRLENGGRNDTIRLLAQLLVRDYGTHLITHVDVGGVIAKEDMISAQFLSTTEATERSKLIRASASYSFFDFFKAGADYEQASDDVKALAAGYINSRSSSAIRSYGGIFYKPELCSNASNCLARWVESVPGNLVTVDRNGDPLHFTIQPSTLRNVSVGTLRRLSQEVAAALRDYYNQNAHRGCLDVSSAAFEYYANMDDNSCKNSTYSYKFGGFFQTCDSTEVDRDAGDLCVDRDLRLANPITGGYSCPINYTKTILRRNVVGNDGCHQECRGWWLWERCNTFCGTSRATYVTYWCAAMAGKASSGAFFGGLYTSTMDNILTNAKSCPPTFLPFPVLTDLKVCLGVDTEYGSRFSVPLGGFFSCDHGNPLYSHMASFGAALHVGAGANEATDPVYAQACPTGFSQHMATIDHDCYVYYCVKANSFGTHGEIELQLPPYVPYDALYEETARQQATASDGTPDSHPSGAAVPVGTVVGITLAAVVAFVLAVTLAIFGWRKWRSRRNRNSEVEDASGNGDGMQRGLLEAEEGGGGGDGAH